eukprot:767206-Hanusia_phi.AAC.2
MQSSTEDQDTFSSLAVLSDVVDDFSESSALVDVLPEDHASRSSKDFMQIPTNNQQEVNSSSTQRHRINGQGPTKEKQLSALEHCIKLLKAKERPRIKNTLGNWFTM